MYPIKVLLFATLRDRAGGRSFIEVDIHEGTTVQELKDKVAREYPNLKEALESVLVAIGREYAFDENVIPKGAEIAMFPPVSGG